MAAGGDRDAEGDTGGDAAAPRVLAGSLFLAQSAVLARAREETRASLSTLNALAAEYGDRDRAAEALPLLERALAGCVRVLGSHDPDTLIVAGNRGVVLARLGRWDDAVAALQDAVVTRARILGPGHPATAAARDALGVTLRLAGHPREALAHHRTALEDRTRALGPGHADALLSRMGLAIAQAEAGEPDGAVAVLEGAVADDPGTSVELTALLRTRLALLLAERDEPRRARRLLASALRECEARLGDAHPTTVAVRRASAELAAGQGA